MQTKPLRAYGIDVTQNTMQPILQSIGINDRTVKELSQGEKQILRYIAVLRQGKVAMGDLADTIESPSNQLKVFRQQLVEAKVALSSLFMGSFANILPYANALLMIIKEVSYAIADMFGIELTDYNTSISGGQDAMEDFGDSIDDASDKAKELKRQFLSFDQVHNINENKDSGGAGGAISGGIDQRLLDAIYSYDNGMSKVRMKATQIRDTIMEWLGFTKLVDSETGDIEFAYTGLKHSIGEITRLFSDFISSSLTKIDKFISNTNWDKIGEGISEILTNIDYKKIISKIGSISGGLLLAMTEVFNNIDWAEFVKGFTKGISKGIEDFNKKFQEIDFDTLGSKISDIFENIDYSGLLNGILTTFRTAVGGLGKILKNIEYKEIAKKISDMMSTLWKNIALLFNDIKWSEVFATIESFFRGWITGVDWIELLDSVGLAITSIVLSGVEGALSILQKSHPAGWIAKMFGIDIGESFGDIYKDKLKDYATGEGKTGSTLNQDGKGGTGGSLSNMKNSYQELNKEINTNIESHKKLTIEAGILEKQLLMLLDSNGKVKKGYEEQAQVIINKLNKSLGTNYTLQENVISINGKEITSRKKIQESIKQTVAERKKEIIANALYKQIEASLNNQIELTYKKSKAQRELADLQKEYNEKVQNGMDQNSVEAKMFLAGIDAKKQKIDEFDLEIENSAKETQTYQQVITDFYKTSGEETENFIENIGSHISKTFENTKTDGEIMRDTINNLDPKISINVDNSKLNDLTTKIDSIFNKKRTITVSSVNITKGATDALNSLQSLLKGLSGKAMGGVYNNGSWSSIPQYASGGIPNRGSMFIAGEAGAEIVGNINGRTEVLNKSQIASAIYSAVKSAMSETGGKDAIEIYAHTDEGVVIDRINRKTKQTGVCPIEMPLG